MGITGILWPFFMVSALQPILRQKRLEASRLRVLHRFEHMRHPRQRGMSPATGYNPGRRGRSRRLRRSACAA